MAQYNLKFHRDFEKELKSIPKKDVGRILAAVDELRTNPTPQGSTKLAGSDAYRIRIGSYRVIYTINDGEHVIFVLKVAHRKDVYR